MNLLNPNDSLAFNLSLNSPFNFICFKCGACCYHRHIELNNFEISQLARSFHLSRFELRQRFLNPGPRPWIKNKSDGSCFFLRPSGCSIYPVRPLVCRLYPLGLLFGPKGEERWGLLPLHPDCLGLITDDKTIEDYLFSQEAMPYLQFERRLRKIKGFSSRRPKTSW